ncbi:hypothetical protein LZQ00_17450 [Sphingobacterium sp. SRCM116780]|uniref:hypothetical protein n=1 Tax=Sphingobacterium sp. SRCM116780 TaxID=2907623 RepID=UPI001F272E16|nr:hypothetical protein [Sphingobacterium sp. SRCM116780]UIR56037.1 hypothetical protein LZQ00_17450 [Sphingobacterium sp. SRCM116780]
MKQKLFILLIVPVLLLQSMTGLFVWTAFQANRDYIAKTQCENRFNAMASSCHGQCVLMKKMKKIMEHESKTSDTKFQGFAMVSYWQEILKLDFLTPSLLLRKESILEWTNLYQFSFSNNLLRPPLS